MKHLSPGYDMTIDQKRERKERSVDAGSPYLFHTCFYKKQTLENKIQ